jgi:GT2 family glycosyltransferase
VIHVVIPVFNGWHQTRKCLDALNSDKSVPVTIHVVDHGSTDETKKELPRDYPLVNHILASDDLWWTGATNVGIRTALERGADTVMLLNNDCYLEPGAIARLDYHRQINPDAIIAPVQIDSSTGALLCATASTCYTLGFPTVVLPNFPHGMLPSSGLLPTRLIVGGRGVVIPSQVIRKVGLLDDAALPHYGSDNDFYLRCRRAGILLFIAADARIRVDRSRTSSAASPGTLDFSGFIASLSDRRSHRNLRDARVLFRRHYPVRPLYWIGLFLFELRYLLLFLLRRQ